MRYVEVNRAGYKYQTIDFKPISRSWPLHCRKVDIIHITIINIIISVHNSIQLKDTYKEYE